jgi:5'-methylthioadenosine nucleosidase
MRVIGIVMAMMAEARPLCAALDAHEVAGDNMLPTRTFEATVGEARTIITVNGVDPRFTVDSIGKETAALTTYSLIQRFQPELVISAGTAGGWARHGTEIGDIFVSEGTIVHHDRRIDLTGFADYGIGHYPVYDATEIVEELRQRLPRVRTGIVTSSNSLDESDSDAQMILRSGAQVKEMEAAAVGYVCGLAQVPVMAIKAITDLVDAHASTADQFTANLAHASDRLRLAVTVVTEILGSDRSW